MWFVYPPESNYWLETKDYNFDISTLLNEGKNELKSLNMILTLMLDRQNSWGRAVLSSSNLQETLTLVEKCLISQVLIMKVLMKISEPGFIFSL